MKNHYLLFFAMAYVSCAHTMSKEDISKKQLQLVLKSVINRETWPEIKQHMSLLIESNPTLVDSSRCDQGGYTPLCHALEHNDIPFVEYLLQKGANPDQCITYGYSRPLFFARSFEAAHLLQNYGAPINITNDSQGITGGMNLLHAAVNCYTEDDRLFGHFLQQGMDPHSLNNNGGNLWHSLITCYVPDHPLSRVIQRAQALHSLHISPFHKDKDGNSAVDIITKKIEDQAQSLDPDFNQRCIEECKERYNKLKIVLLYMKNPHLSPSLPQDFFCK